MSNGNSPFEMLAAFAIVFVAGAMSVVALAAHTRRLRAEAVRDGVRQARPSKPEAGHETDQVAQA